MDGVAAEPQSDSREFCCLEKDPVAADSAVDAASCSGSGGADGCGEPRLVAISFLIPSPRGLHITRTMTPDFAAFRQRRLEKKPLLRP